MTILIWLLKYAREFIVANWRWLAPLVAVLLLWWYIAHLQAQRDDAIKALADYQQNVKLATEKRQAENAAKESAATSQINQALAGHAAEIERIRRDYDAKLGTEKSAHAGDVDQWRHWLRNSVAAAAAGLPTVPGATETTTESGGDGNAAAARYETLATACAVTTTDYNALWKSWDAACKVYGCK